MTLGRDPLADITVLKVMREDTDWWTWRHWACPGQTKAWLAIILFPGQYPKLHVLSFLKWDLSLLQQSLQGLAKEKWSDMQVPMKISECSLLLLDLSLLKKKCYTEKLVTCPSHTFAVMAMDYCYVWPWEVTQESELVCSHCTEPQLQGKILRDPKPGRRVEIITLAAILKGERTVHIPQFSPVVSELSV